MSKQKAIEAWQVLANDPDMIGKKVVFDNRIGDCKDEGTISKITVEGDRFTIESPEIQQAYDNGRAWSPTISFKIDEERDPHKVSNTIFCDIGENRQIRIELN